MSETAKADTLRLERMEGPEIQPIVLTGEEPIVFGRSHLCSFCLQDPSVSRKHASLERRGDYWFVTDLGSRHGTFLNTVRLNPKATTRVRNQDFLTIGPWAFFVLYGASGPDSGYHTTDVREAKKEGRGEPAVAVEEDDEELFPSILLRLGADGQTEVRLSRSEYSERFGAAVIGFARNAGASVGEAVEVLHDVTRAQFAVNGAVEYNPAQGHFRSFLRRLVLRVIKIRFNGERPTDIAIDRLEQDPNSTAAMWNWQWTKLLQQRAMDEVRPRFEAETWEAFERYGRGGVEAEDVGSQLGLPSDEVRERMDRVAKAMRVVVERIRAEEG